MKAILAVVPFFLLAACSATGGGTSAPAPAVAKAGAQYCMKDKLQARGDGIECNWAATVSDACELSNLSSMKKSAMAGEPANAGRCGNGKWLVVVNAR